MPPRHEPTPQIREPVANLPPGEGRTLPHNGYAPSDIAAAQAKGYVVIDVRWEQGQRRVDLIGQGLIIGSVILRPDQMTAYEAEVRLYKESRPVERPPAALTDNILDRLADIRPGKLVAVLQGAPTRPAPPPMNPVKRLTQPTGADETEIAAEVRRLMEEQT